jgi:hypothetical protein
MWLAGAAYLIFLVAVTFLRPFHFSGKIIPFIRIFFPSWRFFDDAGPIYSLMYRIEKGKWKSFHKKLNRNLIQLVFNPTGNMQLASQSLLDRLMLDSQEVAAVDLEKTVSYLLVKNLVHSKVKPEKSFQFKVVGAIASSSFKVEDYLLSPVYLRVKNKT